MEGYMNSQERYMEGYMNSLVYVGVLTLLIYVAKHVLTNKKGVSGRKYAPSVGCLPIIGSIPYLPRDPRELHLWSLKKSSELGPVFSFTVGKMYTVMLNNVETIREALGPQAKDYADRMIHFGNTVMTPNAKGIVFHQYNEEYKKFRVLVLSTLRELGFGKHSMEARICMEIDVVIKKITAHNGEPFYPKEILDSSTCNVISRMLFGRPLEEDGKEDKRLLELIGGITHHINALLPLDIIPSLRFLPFFKKKIEDARVHSIEMMNLIDQKITTTLNSPSDESFVSYYLKKGGDNPDMEQLKYAIRDLIFAGSDTIAACAQWMLLLLANYPEIQKRLQAEIDSVVPRNRYPSLTDMKNLTYVEAVILELMRYKTIPPIGLAHRTSRDTQVGGYFIPSNTIVWTILYAAHMDEKTWTDPTVFRPERFLDADGNIINKDLVIAFALGKRSCIGEILARQQIFLFFTCFLQKFDILPPNGETHISEEAQSDMILVPKPFKVRCLLRSTA